MSRLGSVDPTEGVVGLVHWRSPFRTDRVELEDVEVLETSADLCIGIVSKEVDIGENYGPGHCRFLIKRILGFHVSNSKKSPFDVPVQSCTFVVGEGVMLC